VGRKLLKASAFDQLIGESLEVAGGGANTSDKLGRKSMV
jgi:hypothetical protein